MKVATHLDLGLDIKVDQDDLVKLEEKQEVTWVLLAIHHLRVARNELGSHVLER